MLGGSGSSAFLDSLLDIAMGKLLIYTDFVWQLWNCRELYGYYMVIDYTLWFHGLLDN